MVLFWAAPRYDVCRGLLAFVSVNIYFIPLVSFYVIPVTIFYYYLMIIFRAYVFPMTCSSKLFSFPAYNLSFCFNGPQGQGYYYYYSILTGIYLFSSWDAILTLINRAVLFYSRLIRCLFVHLHISCSCIWMVALEFGVLIYSNFKKSTYIVR